MSEQPKEGQREWLDRHVQKTGPTTDLNPTLGKIVDGLLPMEAGPIGGRPMPPDPLAVAWEKRKELEAEITRLQSTLSEQAQQKQELVTAVMVVVSDPHLTWPDARAKLTAALNAAMKGE